MTDSAGELVKAFQAWLEPQLAPARVVFAAKGSAQTEGVSMTVTRVQGGALDRHAGARLAIDISVLLLVDHPEPAMAATLAGELVFALSGGRWVDRNGESHRLDLADGAETDAAASASGRPAALAVLVRLPLVRAREHGVVRPVLKPHRIEIGEIGSMEGMVLGEWPGETPLPLPAARISAEAYGRTAASDREGRFRLDGLPADGAVTLTVEARGTSRSLTVSERSGVRLVVPIDRPN